MDSFPEFQFDKTTLSVVSLSDQGDDRAYWQSKTPEERLRACEFMRQTIYGYDSTARLQRVIEVVAFKPR
jgi:hypothetical protein